MIPGILGKKIGMTRIYRESGEFVPCSVLQAGPCVVLQLKLIDHDGYHAVQLGFEDKDVKRAKKVDLGRFNKAQTNPKRFAREIRIDALNDIEVGKVVDVGVFSEGDYVDVTGITKGRGFQGGVKRWGWAGGPGSHGSMHHRRVGSIGASSFPSRVFKGRHLPGRMGGVKRTTQNLEIIKIDQTSNLMLVKGAIAGSNGSYVIIRRAKKK